MLQLGEIVSEIPFAVGIKQGGSFDPSLFLFLIIELYVTLKMYCDKSGI